MVRNSRINDLKTTLMVALSLLVILPASALAITCRECREIEKNRRAYSEELEQKSQELKAAFEKRAYDKVAQINVRLSELRKQLTELAKHQDECASACRPDTVKAEECRALKLEIQKLESDEAPSAQQTKKIDDLYLDLLKCNQELRRLLGQEE
ncbi:MAG: hypothetical protein LDL33_10635 [Desulfomonile sp.]|nr:hypothetical protein [Desulfomonile sp.]